MAKLPPTPERILATALELAEDEGWGAVRLRRVADRLAVAPAHVRRHFRDKDALADAWLATADTAMLVRRPRAFAPPPGAGTPAHGDLRLARRPGAASPGER